MRLKLFLILFCSAIFSFCQERITILGKIRGNNISLSNIHIYNLNSSKGVVSDKDGSFEISVKLADVLVFTSVQFSVVKRKITAKNIKDKRIIISIFSKINLLNEVVINSTYLTGNLLKDTENVPKNFKKHSFYKLYLSKIEFTSPSIAEANTRKPPDPLKDHSTPQMINIMAVLSPLLKKIGEKHRAKKLNQKRVLEIPAKIRQELGDTFFIKELKIEKTLIDNFLDFCNTKGVSSLYMQNKKIELIELLYKLQITYLAEVER